MKKKSQFEIFGVVLIVIILVLAMFFLIGNSLKKNSDISQSFVDTELGQNMLTTMMRMNIEDCGTTLDEVIKYCVNGQDNVCGPQAEDHPCRYAKEVITNILDNTLLVWGKKYRFQILVGNIDKLKEKEPNPGKTIENNCGDFSEKEAPGILPLPSRGGSPILVKLEICK